ncbi:MAG: hypothetical protein FWH37_01935 [Candidatus Bathyarchaeota archaeon]|nr:hypothetical protein [Candidatus Termiticorpusculum sp.]
MKSIIIFNGKTPSEHEQLTHGSFNNTPSSFVDHNRKIMGLLCFIAGISCITLSLFFWSTITFGTLVLWGRLLFLCLALGIILFCLGINFFRDRPTIQNFTKPQHIIQQYVKCLIDTNYFYIGVVNAGNSYATLQRMLPETQKVDYKTFTTYLKNLHSKMLQIVKEDTKNLNIPEYSFKASSINSTITSKKTVSLGVKRLTMETNLYVKNTQYIHYSIYRNKFISTKISHIKLIFNMSLVQLDKKWFVYDPLPDYKIEKQVTH